MLPGTARRLPPFVDPMTPVSIDVHEPDAGHVVVAIAGEIDVATAPLVAGVLRWYPHCDVIVDLTAVRLLDASGLSALVSTQQRLKQTGHTLRTTGERGIVLAAVRVGGLEDTFHGHVAGDPPAIRPEVVDR
ncbi:MAG TPA: STAS domain-containing protein [Acidimicrobiia bacterium]|nr:STAS domain-containing protein [Acidimicrobiia bacterium]